MFDNAFTSEALTEALDILKTEFPLAIWETIYVTLLSTLFAIIIGLPLGVLLVAGEKGGVLPLPKGLMKVLNVIINLLRSVPFLILMILVFPLTRLIVGTAVGTVASIVPLVIASFPFVARLVESSLREVNPNIIEAAQSMGASPMQIIVKVMIPESVPSLLELHNSDNHHTRLLRNERNNRRRRTRQDSHKLRLLPLQIPRHALCRHTAYRARSDIPERRHAPCDKDRQETQEIIE